MNIPVGGPYRWITVAAEGRDDLQLSIEPNANPADRAFQEAMFAQNIPATAFLSTAIDEDFAPQSALCVAFTSPPRQMGTVKAATFSDTVGNLNQLYEVVAK